MFLHIRAVYVKYFRGTDMLNKTILTVALYYPLRIFADSRNPAEIDGSNLKMGLALVGGIVSLAIFHKRK
jgi:hypothetical protein